MKLSIKKYTINQYHKLILLLGFLFFSQLNLLGQLYPVQLNQSLIPPYDTNLSSYSTTTATKLNLQLLLTDVQVSNRQVRLKLYIEGQGLSIQSREFVIGAPPIFLDGGVPQTFTNVDLKAYFAFNNLLGITPQQYSRSLPDGFYNICWEVYDFITNERLSAKRCSSVMLLLNDPPLLNLPQRGENKLAQEPTNIIFQWTPRHANATNVSYDFELREIWDSQIDPQAAFLASSNYYSETTYSTTLLYDIGKPALISGKRYAWRVKAKSISGISENSVFKNEGYSEIYYFTYSPPCDAPLYPMTEALSPSRVKISWQETPSHNKYHLQYRKSNKENAEWFDVYTYNSQAQIGNLESGEVYDFRVGGTCNNVSDLTLFYTYSNINQFTMPTKEEMASYNCGVTPDIAITNTKALTNIGVNETFTAGDFPVTVKEISGSSGIFSGKGYIVVPYLQDSKIAVEFSGIKINTDYQLYEGVLSTTYDASWDGVEDIDDVIGGDTGVGVGIDITVEFAIGGEEDIHLDDDGDIVITGSNGDTFELEGGKDYVITDSKGNQYAIDKDGRVKKLGKQAKGGKPTPENTNGVNEEGESTEITAKGVLVTFRKSDKNVYGFDAYEASQESTAELYKKLGSYYLPYKSIKNGSEDYIIANIAITDRSIVADSIVFKTQDGTAIPATNQGGNQWELKLKGYQNNAVKEVLATIKQGDKYKVAGAFKLYHLQEREVEVVLVNTNNASREDIQKKLNQVYRQAVVKVNIVKEITDFTETLNQLAPKGIASSESTLLSNYSSQQRRINKEILNRNNANKAAYYIITTDKASLDKNGKPNGVSGYMKVAAQFGYIFGTNPHTVAHELGHGAFKLKHPFSKDSYGWRSESTNWLMDYKGGEHLPFVHWKEMNNPKVRIGIFDEDDEGEDRENDGIDLLGNIIVKVKQSEDDAKEKLIIGFIDEAKPYLRTGYEVRNLETLKSEIYIAKIQGGKVEYYTRDNKKLPYEIELITKGKAVVSATVQSKDCAYKYQVIDWEKPKGRTTAEISSEISKRINKGNWKYRQLYDKNCDTALVEKYKTLFGADVIYEDCFKRSLNRVKRQAKTRLIPHLTGIYMLTYTGAVEYGICRTEEDKLPLSADYLTKFSYGFVNELLRSLDIDGISEAVAKVIAEKIAKDIQCLLDERGNRLMIIGPNQDQLEYLQECSMSLTYHDIEKYSKLITEAWKWVKENQDNPYVHGKATFFIASIAVPYLLEVKALQAEKLLTIAQKEAYYTDDVAKLYTKLKGKNIDEAIDIFQDLNKLANTVGKTNLLKKLDNLPFAKKLVNNLDDVADASFLSKIDNLTNDELLKLEKFYSNLSLPGNYKTLWKLNFEQVAVLDDFGTIKIKYKNGLPNFKEVSPNMNFVDGSSSKFKYFSESLNGGKLNNSDFKLANEALAKKMGIEKVNGKWPKLNSEGYLQKGNYRWKKIGSNFSLNFELKINGKWKKMTWHHFEDGKTMFPVPTDIHNNSLFRHSGGKSVIDYGDATNLKGKLFEFDGF